MKYQAILFDLDGTLLPMDNDEFTKVYFGLLAKKAAPYGYQLESLVPALWKGVKAMVMNDGTCTNKDAFWEVFAQIFGQQAYDHIPVFDDFYTHEFHGAAAVTGKNTLAVKAVELAKEKAGKVVLATNPLFPPAGVETRLSWVNLKPEQFDHWTHYENSSYCKPNPEYYKDILKKMGLEADKCLMIGNDAQEDVEAAYAAGMDAFLVTDCLIDRGNRPESKQGSFEELIAFLEKLE